ncbi:MAG TPA: PLP-dependent transferase, partial [Firmicutes bacterium]|nr:PLP-dependent transferase [Bacillota bacterium]
AHSGDHVIANKTVYGGTYALMTKIFEELKIEVTFVDDMKPATLDAALRPNTKVVYSETMANPTLSVANLTEIAQWAKAHKVTSIIDSTFTSPYLVRPLEFGIDVVVHSTTKYINGHGDIIGGIIAGSFEFVDAIRSSMYQELGPVPSPFSCWLQLRGLKTLHLRMKQHCANALALAQWLEKQDAVEKVIYPGLESHPDHELAKKQFGGLGYGGIVTFIMKGDDIESPKKVIDNCHLAKYCVSLGDLDTLIEQPATMTHGKIDREERYKMGVTDGMIRVSVGVEDIDDIIADFDHAFKALG